MSEEDHTPFSPMHPAIPSRATGEVKPLQPAPMFDELPARLKPRRKVKRTARLPDRVIKRINKNRKQNMKKRGKTKLQVVRQAARDAGRLKPVPENRNRPLEMKNRLHVVLTAVAAMTKAEALAFTGVMQHLEDMSRPSRKRIISALAQVYA